MIPEEIAAIAGLRVDPEVWRERTQAALDSLRKLTRPTARERLRRQSLQSYARRVQDDADRGRRAVPNWLLQPTGRWSSEDPNLHSITKSFGVRDAVIPEDGYRFVRADWASAHLVVMAGLSQDRQLLADIESGDAYRLAAGELLPDVDPDKGRAVAKIAVLSAINGAGPEKLAATLSDAGTPVDAEEARRRREAWLSRYPTARAYMERAAEQREWTTTTGRTVSLPPGEKSYVGLGWRWQSHEADALSAVLRRLLAERPHWTVAFCFYDEVLIEAPEAEAPEAEAWLREVMDDELRSAARLPPGDPERTTKVSIRETWSGVPRQHTKGSGLAASWRTLETWAAEGGWSWDEQPPEQRWLLRSGEVERGVRRDGPGVMPRGDVGIFAGAGAVGKSYALLHLAACVATPAEAHQAHPDQFAWFGGVGRKGGWWVAPEATGRVVMVLGEEKIEHARQRLWRIRNAMGLRAGASDRRAKLWAAEQLRRFVLVPARGMHLGWIGADGKPTDAYREIAGLLGEHEHSLIILDPLARFAGADTEKDNAAATRLVELAERLSLGPGEPNVILTHHTSQDARQRGATDATAARGVTGLGDGGRWGASLVGRKRFGDEVRLLDITPNKANHAPEARPLTLRRLEGPELGGVLAVATEAERDEWKAAEEANKPPTGSDRQRPADSGRTNGARVRAVDGVDVG